MSANDNKRSESSSSAESHQSTLSNDYRDTFYQAYASSHTITRKGELTPEKLRTRARQWNHQFSRFLPKQKNASILDVGCGDGALLWWLQQIGFTNAEGVEVSKEQVVIARRLGVDHVHQADLNEFLSSKVESYDLLILRNVLEHFRKSEILEILRLCRSALRPEGRVVIQVPNGESPFFGRIRYGDFTHEIAFCASSLAQVLHVMDFKNCEFYPVRPFLPGVWQMPRRVLWRVVESVYRLCLMTEAGRSARIVTLDILAYAQK